LAFARVFEATAQDDALDVLDLMIGSLLARVENEVDCVKRAKTNRRFDGGRTRKTAETVQPERLKPYSDFG
jgi:hypothetical protein